jgi:hypothetical protein
LHQSIRATPPLYCGPLWPGPLTAPRLCGPSLSSVMAGSLNDIAGHFADGRPVWTSRAIKRGLDLNRPLSCPSSSPPVRLVPSTAAAGESRHRVSSGLGVEPGRVFCTRGCCSCPQLRREAAEPQQFLVVDRFPSQTTSHRDRVLLRRQGRYVTHPRIHLDLHIGTTLLGHRIIVVWSGALFVGIYAPVWARRRR